MGGFLDVLRMFSCAICPLLLNEWMNHQNEWMNEWMNHQNQSIPSQSAPIFYTHIIISAVASKNDLEPENLNLAAHTFSFVLCCWFIKISYHCCWIGAPALKLKLKFISKATPIFHHEARYHRIPPGFRFGVQHQDVRHRYGKFPRWNWTKNEQRKVDALLHFTRGRDTCREVWLASLIISFWGTQ